MNGQQAQIIEKEAQNMPLEIGFKRLSDNAILPTKVHASDSGFDLFAAEDVVIAPGETKVIKTHLAVVLPEGHDAYIKNRSGISSKTKLRVVSPPIDEGYRGEIGIILDNISQEYITSETRMTPYLRKIDGRVIDKDGVNYYRRGSYKIFKGDKIAQLTIQPRPNTVAFEVTGELSESDRGINGWGSSGV